MPFKNLNKITPCNWATGYLFLQKVSSRQQRKKIYVEKVLSYCSCLVVVLIQDISELHYLLGEGKILQTNLLYAISFKIQKTTVQGLTDRIKPQFLYIIMRKFGFILKIEKWKSRLKMTYKIQYLPIDIKLNHCESHNFHHHDMFYYFLFG